MGVGILLITHNELGSALLETATKMLGQSPLVVETMAVTLDSEPELLLGQAQSMLQDLDQGDGVLVLSDMYGSTPCNIACRLQRPVRTRVGAGINLPMLVRVLNYAHLDLINLTAKALSGGCDGIVSCKPQP